ncbi:MAG: hypothetical protein M0Z25_07650 [Nitrospiraceae bacterium]|nr:hypothetical protein [Nitrospiraceae bacterium]
MGKLEQTIKKSQIRNLLSQTGWQKLPFQTFLKSCPGVPGSQKPFPILVVQGFGLNGLAKKSPGHRSPIPVSKNVMGGLAQKLRLYLLKFSQAFPVINIKIPVSQFLKKKILIFSDLKPVHHSMPFFCKKT